ncbi:MAG: hypothetical protein IPO62_14675 [Saprospiraceae bacterium]|nr:hypothetical protein [Saprospiraceae bacterium]
MAINTNILELKYYGNNINPEAVRASEVADLIKGFEGAILSVAFDKRPDLSEYENKFPFITISAVENQSLGLKHKMNAYTEIISSALLLIASSLNNNSYNSLPIKAIEDLKVLTRFAKRHECDGSFYLGGEQIVNFGADKEIKIDDSRYIKGETTIYGILNKIGGNTPSLQLRINNYFVSFDVKKTIAVKLGTKLYKENRFKGFFCKMGQV